MTPSETVECYQVPNQDPWCGIHGSEDWSTCAVKRKELEAAFAAKDAEIERLRDELERIVHHGCSCGNHDVGARRALEGGKP